MAFGELWRILPGSRLEAVDRTQMATVTDGLMQELPKLQFFP